MMRIEALCRPFKLDEVKATLRSLDCEEVTLSEVLHHGDRNIQENVYRGWEYEVDVPKVKIEFLVSAHRVEEVLDALSQAACAGNDGAILVFEVAEAIRIRNGHRVEFSRS